jgi:hypothetical protein
LTGNTQIDRKRVPDIGRAKADSAPASDRGVGHRNAVEARRDTQHQRSEGDGAHRHAGPFRARFLALTFRLLSLLVLIAARDPCIHTLSIGECTSRNQFYSSDGES